MGLTVFGFSRLPAGGLDGAFVCPPVDGPGHQYIDEERSSVSGSGGHADDGDMLTEPLCKATEPPPTLDTAIRMFAEDVKGAKNRKARRYYQAQLDLLRCFHDDKSFFKPATGDNGHSKNDAGKQNSAQLLARVTLVVNVALIVAKSVAAGLSGSLAVISSVVDSAVDVTSGLIICLTSRAIRKRDIRIYPRGRTRLEPLALIIISFVMGSASVQIIAKSIEGIISNRKPDVGIATVAIMACTVVVKLALFVLCRMQKDSSSKILAQDHRNDCLSNAVAIICAYLATYYDCNYLDGLGAILVSIYILVTWTYTGLKYVSILSGRTAKPEVLNRILKICVDHAPEVRQIDTIFAYHFGSNYLVEVHVVMDEHTDLKSSHDVSERLQQKIEQLPFVERAFVHVDYDVDHRPENEHKVV